MTFARFVKGDKVVIPFLIVTDIQRRGDVINWEGHRYRVLGPQLEALTMPLMNGKSQSVSVYPVEELDPNALVKPFKRGPVSFPALKPLSAFMVSMCCECHSPLTRRKYGATTVDGGKFWCDECAADLAPEMLEAAKWLETQLPQT